MSSANLEAPQYGGFFRRFLALVIDALIVAIPCAIAGHVIPFVGALAVVVLYHPVFESSAVQTTPGKFLMGMKVVNETQGRLSFSRALVRHLMAYVSAFLFCFGYFMQVFTVKRQTLHDMVAGALVIRYVQVQAPNWLQVWLEQMRNILGVEETKLAKTDKGASVVTDEGLTQIQKLQELLKSGALTEDEFQTQKSQILSRMLNS